MARLKTVCVALAVGVFGVAMSALMLGAEDEKKGGEGPNLAAARKASADNLERLARAVIDYAHDHEARVPPLAVMGKDGKPLSSWRVLILPYLKEEKLYKEFRLDEPWDSEHNKKLLEKMPKVFAPVRGQTKEPHATYYQAIVGEGAGFEARRRLIYPGSYPDGLSMTIMLAEAAEAVPWTKPADLDYDPKKPLPKFGGLFPDGFHVVMWCVEVHFFKKDFDEQAMRPFITRAAGDLVDYEKLER